MLSEELRTTSAVAASASVTPNGRKPGPTARTRTIVPDWATKKPIDVRSPARTYARDEELTRRDLPANGYSTKVRFRSNEEDGLDHVPAVSLVKTSVSWIVLPASRRVTTAVSKLSLS